MQEEEFNELYEVDQKNWVALYTKKLLFMQNAKASRRVPN
jgi:hypothetical protein